MMRTDCLPSAATPVDTEAPRRRRLLAGGGALLLAGLGTTPWAWAQKAEAPPVAYQPHTGQAVGAEQVADPVEPVGGVPQIGEARGDAGAAAPHLEVTHGAPPRPTVSG